LKLGFDMWREAESRLTSRPASESKINATIELEYDKAESANKKPPNVREIAQQVQKAFGIGGAICQPQSNSRAGLVQKNLGSVAGNRV
jgi:hypothetical protein